MKNKIAKILWAVAYIVLMVFLFVYSTDKYRENYKYAADQGYSIGYDDGVAAAVTILSGEADITRELADSIKTADSVQYKIDYSFKW